MSDTEHADPFVLTEDYQVMPPLADEEFASLKASIRENGVQDPIVHDEEMRVIDGHHRVQACRELGRDMSDVPTDARAGYTDDEKRDLAYRLNLQRRHLEHGQKSDLVEQYLTEEWDGDNSGEWYEDVANRLGVSPRTVQRAYTELKEAGKFRHLAIFSKDDKREQVRQYLENNPDASTREVADAVDADVSHATVGNWRDEYGWTEDDGNSEDDDDTPKVQSFGRGTDAEDRAETSKELVDKATDGDADDQVRETARENAAAVNKGETDLESAAYQVSKTERKQEQKINRSDATDVEQISDLKILNLYAGIGGNRRLWGDEADVTAVEWDEEKANIYRNEFPNDTVIETDAHEYLLQHYDEYDFIWTSPPCPTHTKMQYMFVHGENESSGNASRDAVYPDMRLYQEIILLDSFFYGKYVVENVQSYYEPLIEPTSAGRHYFWSNFNIDDIDVPKFDKDAGIDYYEELFNYNLSRYEMDSQKKKKTLRNCVHPELGKHIIESAAEEIEEVVN